MTAGGDTYQDTSPSPSRKILLEGIHIVTFYNLENIFPFSRMCSKSISGTRDLFLFLAHYLISFVISFVSCTITNVITSVTSSKYDEMIFVYR